MCKGNGAFKKGYQNESKDTKNLILSEQLGGWLLIVGAEVEVHLGEK